MKATFAGVLGGFQSLGHDEAHEKPVDRLGALASVQIARSKDAERTAALCSLGVELIRYKFAHIETARHDAIDRLILALAWRHKADDLTPAERYRVARWAVQEWARDLCPARPDGCGGALQVPDHEMPKLEGVQPMRPCPVCKGTGKRRYKDEERVEAMGAAFAVAMDEAHALIAWAESLAVQRAKHSLERD